MALNIAVPMTGVGGISPISPIGLVDCWDNVKILASPIGSESSGVSSLDSDELKGQQCHSNHNNHHHQLQEPLQQQAFTLDLKSTSQTNVTKNSNQNFSNINNNINLNNINNINNNNNNALYINVNNNNSQKKIIIVKKLQDLKIMYNGRDILDLGKNIETNTKLWNLKYTYLPENNNIPMFLANRSQYHRLGANGHIQEYTLYHCDHCDYQFPVMINTANYMAQTSLNVTLTSNSSSALYTNSSNNKSGISVPNTNLTNSTSTITSIHTNGGIGNSGTIDSKQDKPMNNKNISLHNNNSKPVKKIQLTKEELNECDFSYTLKKVLIDYNNSLNNGMQNFPIKCNNNINMNNNNNNGIISNNQIPSIFSHSVAAVAAAAALSPQLSSQATSPSCCSSSGYSSNGSTHSLFSGGNNGIKYPVAAMAPNCNNHNNNINNMNVQNNFNKNNIMPFQQQQQQAKLNYNKSPTGGIINNTNNNNNNNNNSIYSLLNSLNNNMNGNGNNNGNCNNNIYGNNYWNNNNNNNTNGSGLSYGANNNNISNQMNIHNPNLNNNSANNQNFARMYKYF